ncbi:uncharacterized protein [Equus przewalskii]|uniref:Uncharacterized protein isoform X2 n=1 Tax=Equus przewalskii TaxID=9798 RepID=A0ABM4QE52_EQUPR
MSCSYPRWWLAGWKVSAGSQAALPVGESQAREVSSHSLPVWRSMRMPLCLCSVCGRVFPLWASAGRPLLPAAAATGRCLCRAPPRRWSRSWRMGPTAPSPWTGGKCSRPPTLPGAGLRGEMRLASLRVIWPGSHLGGPAYLPQVQLQHLGPRRAELEGEGTAVWEDCLRWGSRAGVPFKTAESLLSCKVGYVGETFSFSRCSASSRAPAGSRARARASSGARGSSSCSSTVRAGAGGGLTTQQPHLQQPHLHRPLQGRSERHQLQPQCQLLSWSKMRH